MTILSILLCILCSLALSSTAAQQSIRSNVKTIEVTVSAYTRDCDKSNKKYLTSSSLSLKRKHCRRVIALSRDLARSYQFHDKFQLCFDSVCYDVVYEDKMKVRKGKAVDLLVWSTKEAKKFGVKKGKLTYRR